MQRISWSFSSRSCEIKRKVHQCVRCLGSGEHRDTPRCPQWDLTVVSLQSHARLNLKDPGSELGRCSCMEASRRPLPSILRHLDCRGPSARASTQRTRWIVSWLTSALPRIQSGTKATDIPGSPNNRRASGATFALQEATSGTRGRAWPRCLAVIGSSA